MPHAPGRSGEGNSHRNSMLDTFLPWRYAAGLVRFLIIGLVLTFAVAVTASVFAIWPAVGDAPWEDEVAVAVEETTDVRCEGALDLREAVIDAGIMGSNSSGRLTGTEFRNRMRQAEGEIDDYC